MTTIPVIDFSKLDGEERAHTLSQISKGCEEWGFFQLVNHGIPVELLERVKKVAAECFKVEREEAFKNSKPVKLLNELVETKKNGKVENVDWEDVFLLTDDNEWPSKTPQFKETMKEYRSEVKKLAERVMEVMDENLRLPKGYIKKVFNEGDNNGAFFGTKVSHYPPCPHPEKVNGLRAHTDAGGVILLFQDDQVDGLQILKDGEWIDVLPVPYAIVINTGDQIEVLSNGKYKSIWHRVLSKPDGNRRSIASFYNPSLKATIAPAPELLVDDQKDIKKKEMELTTTYPTFVFGEYMNVYNEQKFLPKEPRFEAVGAV
ncbi:1-aminocyclopropane-1-carboxylate oxidase 5-like [Lycium barbarum]|uniref:1-aminocyclopropane-1-carboxylate oxidase 5-like n=1 Tax=Lycium barbarum TaxID=112863 RepID=UPI00293E572B|nr:1-aminocyclopropane-1-carboxylate oxidase 5-like [Lycium barbarum]